MVFPWMFEDFAALRPLKAAAELLAAKANWPQLYDLQSLQSTSVPVASATYFDDMYVEHNHAQVRAPLEVNHASVKETTRFWCMRMLCEQ
jgi:hypothetical protein